MPTCVEYMDNITIKSVERYLGTTLQGSDKGNYLIVEVEGTSEDDLDEKACTMDEICSENGAGDVLVAENDKISQARKAFAEAVRAESLIVCKEDVVCPVDHEPALLAEILRLAEKYQLVTRIASHAGDGNIHLNILKQEQEDYADWDARVKANQQELYREVQSILSAALVHRDIIPEVPVDTPKKNEMEVPKIEKVMPEPFEQKRLEEIRKAVRKDSPYEIKYPVSRPMGTGSVSSAAQEKLLTTIKSMQPEQTPEADIKNQPEQPEEQILTQPEGIRKEPLPEQSKKETEKELAKEAYVLREEETYGAKPEGSYEQGSFLKEEEMAKQKIIGQLFDTYWLVEYNDRLFIVDQHAAHEKVMYEKLKKQFEKKEFTSQAISPPIVITLSMREAEVLERFKEQFTKLGFEIEHFGGAEYSICGVPGNLYRLNTRDVLIDMLDELTDGISERATADVILDKIASMSCKAAVKGSQRLSLPEMEQLMKDLMKLDNPYNCPHGRPTIIAMSKYEIEKKFKRIV